MLHLGSFPHRRFARRRPGRGVDAGVGATGSVDSEIFAGEFAEDVNESALNGGLAGLDLPAAEVGAVIGEGELDVAHERESSVVRLP